MDASQIPNGTPNSPQPQKKPLLSLPEILLSLADVFKFNMTERAMNAYALALGHRTDEDLNAGYREILASNKFMPTPAELREACPVMKQRRDGTRA